ncbi:NADP-dependent malic enzyme [bacterium]|nr:NADP-dependent malic enzyme [bacterium]MDB4088262.1 NADP-dependent malic enzyme [Flavobacteriales bacterium]
MKNKRKKNDALRYHSHPKPGKIEVVPTKKYSSQRDLSLAYSPGVAEPCLAIAENKDDVYKYTSKGNLVAVISNGTAVLGLGNIGPEASKPVMEGKGLLFKIFADIDVFDIEVDTEDIDKFVETVKNIAPTFGGINLEDIKAPEAFEIERRLVEELDIPVMHDDQHGTAIISTAALKNAIEITGKKLSRVKIVVNGAGAAAISCTRLYISLGAKKKNILMCDSKGVIQKSRTDLTPQKEEFATDKTDQVTLEDAMKGADVFVGLSKGNIVTPEMLLTMAKNPIVFAMANPEPEIDYNLAVATRDDIIMATGRSDFPNQVNNVLGFPFIFRGALDVRATKINEAMKMAAVHALADLAKESVPEQVNITYNEVNITFGKDYIIPKPFDNRLISVVPPAVAKAAMESGVALEPITNWAKYRNDLEDRLGTGNKIIRLLHNRAKSNPKRVVFAEGDHLDILKAAQVVYDEGMAIPILLGDKDTIEELMEEIGFDADIEIIDPKSYKERKRKREFAEKYWELRQRKGVTFFDADKLMRDRNYFATMMLNEGDADAFISGYARKYSSVLRPLIEIVPKVEGVDKVSSTNVMLTKRGPMFFSDTAITPNPTGRDLALIAEMTGTVVKMFGLTPAIAMLSYSNFGSVNNHTSRKVKEAIDILHETCPDLIIDGELQANFALNPTLLKEKFPFSKLVGKNVNALIFPNLDSANINYKLLKELNESDSIGPVIMGLTKPAHILQLGASVDEIVNMTALAVVDAQNKEAATN